MACRSTMLDLVVALSKGTRTEAEVIATVIYLVNAGAVRLCGTFSGARFDPRAVDGTSSRGGTS